MLKITSEDQHDKLSCEDSEIVLSGPPESLAGFITLKNDQAEKVFVRNLSLKAATKTRSLAAKAGPSIDGALDLHATLGPNEERSQRTTFSLSPNTAPGTYTSSMMVGGKERKVKMVVQEKLDVELIPDNIVMVGLKPGTTHRKEILLANKGNIPIQVPNIKHNTTLDMDQICRNLSKALRECGDQGSNATMDAFFKGMRKDLADWVELSIKEAGQVIQPGKSLLLHFEITLPKDISEQRMYDGEIRIFDELLTYTIISTPVVKRKGGGTKTPRNTKGPKTPRRTKTTKS